MPQTAIPPKLVEQLIEDHGRDISKWNDELRDLVDPTISARMLNPPLSGQIKLRKNRDFQYFWAKDVCGASPDHTRIEDLRSQGWDFATTDDVEMCSAETVKGRNGKGFSNEIRSGDRRLMKLPMDLWRAHRKSQLVLAYQYAYPQAMGNDGQPMTAKGLLPGLKTAVVGPESLEEWQRRSVPDDLENGVIGNTAVHRPEAT